MELIRKGFAAGVLCVGIATAAVAQVAPAASPGTLLETERVTFKSDELSLVGFLYKPEGTGPWPALIWNHGSERNPDRGAQFDTVASIFVPAGYVVFAPVRRGHGDSEGRYIVDRIRGKQQQQGHDESMRTAVRLLETEQLQDQLEALAYLKKLPFVDAQRVVVAGCSFGGIETLLGAESTAGAGYQAAVSISPAALSWRRNSFLQARLLEAVARIDIPVLLIQPPKDASLEPARVLGAEAARLGKPLTAKVYPSEGPEDLQGHCFGGVRGMRVWAEEAKSFFAQKLQRDAGA
jgi:carboxymethylenebutenolidase